MTVAWIDLEALTPKTVEQSIDHVFSLWPAETAQFQPQLRWQMAQPVEKFTTYHAALMAAGVRGVLLGTKTPDDPDGEGSWFMLLHVQAGTTPERVNEILAERLPDMKKFELEPFERRWLAVIEPERYMLAPIGGDDEMAATFSTMLPKMGDAAVRVAVHRNAAIRAMHRQQGSRKFSTGLERGTVAIHVGETVSLQMVLRYEDAQAAERGVEDLAFALAVGVVELPKILGVQQRTVSGEATSPVLRAIEHQLDGSKFTLILGRDFFAALGNLAPYLVERDAQAEGR